jgi:outer membrane protein
MRSFAFSLLTATVMCAAVPQAFAADLPSRTKPATAPVTAIPDEFNPWMVRVRAIGVLPDSSGKVSLNGSVIPGSNVKVSNSVVPEADISYFFTRNIAVEVIAAVTPHKVKARGSIAGLGEIGKSVVLPPTVLLQYHFTELGAFKPYVGVGVNYTHYFKDSSGPNFYGLKIKDSWGVAGQVGVDYMIDKHWGINLDVKKVMMEPKATVGLKGVGPLTAKVKINPWIVGAGVTYRF